MAGLLDRVLRMGEGRILKRLEALTKQVNSLEDEMKSLSDEQLRAETDKFKERIAGGESLESLLPEAFAVVREASVRTLGQRHFDVQIMGGAALHLGNIAEMKTGEGKTLVATLPAYLNALSGKGVHVVTVNDYLASYQSDLMGRVFRFLGLTTGTITAGLTPEQRREQYNADITYGTNNEFGFDYLRDNMAWKRDDLVQRGHHMAIVDEVDSILIDEARTPLIISGPAQGDINKWYAEFARVARRLVRDEDYEVDEKKRTVGVLEPGIAKVEDYLGIDNLYETLNTPLVGFLNNSIKAKELFARDRDYVVMKGEVLIVDQHTGRMLAGRRYNDGMHQAIEAKEGVAIKAENQTFATITLQNYFRMYDKLAGMTGTAETEAAEFQSTYEMGVVPIPPNRPLARVDQPDLIYKTKDAKFAAVVQDIKERHAKGQPVLVGTTNVETSELLSGLLKKAGIPHDVLNAKQHAREASIVAMAGRKGAVTVATNMAGRGTDIMLGGNAEFIATEELARRGLTPSDTPEEYEQEWPKALAAAKEDVAEEHDEVAALGGLYVLGTERHESRRIDNQLRGRSGRQGDNGESRFYLSVEDDLMRLFNQALVARVMNSSGFPDDMPLESKMVTKGIASAQSQVEARNFEIRKNVLKYDDVLSRQRETVYAVRREILDGEDLAERIQGYLEHVIRTVVSAATPGGSSEAWDLEQLWNDLKVIYPISLEINEVLEEFGGAQRLTQEDLIRELTADAKLAYAQREEQLTPELMREVERRVLLSVLDRKWRDHLYEMDYLKEGIGLRAMAQRDPVVEYQIEGHRMFQAMDEAIKEETVGYIFNVKLPEAQEGSQTGGATEAEAKAPSVDEQLGLKTPDQPTKLTYSAPSEDGGVVQSQGGRPRNQARAQTQSGAPGQAAAVAGNREDRRRAAKAAKKRS